jgi:hypothetical protein
LNNVQGSIPLDNHIPQSSNHSGTILSFYEH